jgi:branched-chain amino acid transport system substrate-binding protein
MLMACSTAPTNRVVKIGFFGPLSGEGASDGTSARNAALLAITQANTAQVLPGTTLELVAYDDRLDDTETATIAHRLIEQDGVRAVIDGSYSTTSRVAAPIFQQAGIPMIVAYAGDPQITTAGDQIFRVIYTATTLGQAMAIFHMENLGYRSFHVIHSDNDYGTSLRDAFTQTVVARGGTVVGVYALAEDTSVFSPTLDAVAATPADAIVLATYYGQSADLIRHARQQGITTPILGDDGMDSPAFLARGGRDVEGVVIATDFSRDDPRPLVKDFIRAYQDMAGSDPDFIAASAYDATNVLINALQRSDMLTADQIRAALATAPVFEGVTGTIRFTPQREVSKTILFVQVTKGRFVFLDKVDPERLPK